MTPPILRPVESYERPIKGDPDEEREVRSAQSGLILVLGILLLFLGMLAHLFFVQP